MIYPNSKHIQGDLGKNVRTSDQDVDLATHMMCTSMGRSIVIVLICNICLHSKPLIFIHTGQLSRPVLSGSPCNY